MLVVAAVSAFLSRWRKASRRPLGEGDEPLAKWAEPIRAAQLQLLARLVELPHGIDSGYADERGELVEQLGDRGETGRGGVDETRLATEAEGGPAVLGVGATIGGRSSACTSPASAAVSCRRVG